MSLIGMCQQLSAVVTYPLPNCGPSNSNATAFVPMRGLPNLHRFVKRKSDVMHYLDRRIQDR
jgi:hypothetical protein